MFKGCCYYNDGTHSTTINLKTIENALDYIKLQVVTGKQARILDSNNRVVLMVADGRIIIPEAMRTAEIRNQEICCSKKKKEQRGTGPEARVCRR